MKELLRGLACVLAIAFIASQTEASVVVHANFTADNVTQALYQDGSAPVNIPGISGDLNIWQDTKSVDFTLVSLPGGSHTYQLIFRVHNDGTYGDSGNPAGFLAQLNISGDGYPSRLSGPLARRPCPIAPDQFGSSALVTSAATLNTSGHPIYHGLTLAADFRW